MRVGEVAAGAGVHRETLRYYERRGLIVRPPRAPSGYRRYPAETVERVRFIKWAQGLGFTLREVLELARIPRDHIRRRARGVRARAVRKIGEIEGKIARLRVMKRQLAAIAACRCNGNCPIVAEGIAVKKNAR